MSQSSTSRKAPVESVAVIELGTNAVRLMLARVKTGVGFEVLREARTQTRLGGRESRISRVAIAATLEVVHDFLRAAHPVRPRIVAVATAAVRDAHNADALLDALRARDRVDVRVLSADEEAELGARAAMFSLPIAHARVVDLGGGSLQVAEIADGRATVVGSVPLGVLAMTRRFLHTAKATPPQLAALRRHVRLESGPLLRHPHDGAVIGLGGTIRTLARMHDAATTRRDGESVHGRRLHADDIGTLRARLERLSVGRRSEIPGLKAERADTILAGAVIVEEILALAHRKTLTVCGRGVRHGVLIREAFTSGGPA